MITENELRIANESYLQQDFYQLYPSILDLVKKITDRWDPSSSNESDPGVVILKLLAFMGDKLDYNTDKNILECFMPSATQEESMRKLCDMMGYEMHYYRSATTPVSFMWVGSKDILDTTTTSGKTVTIPKFANITNTVAEESAVKAVNYILTKQVELNYAGQVESADAIEGQLVDFSINGDDIIRLSNIINNRLYFPEVKIAENGVWIFNLDDDNKIDESIDWIRTTNLNTAITTTDKHYWKFCFDSKRKVPYILFSDDIANIIKNGLRIKYVRTSGANGNISAKTLDSITTKIYTTDHPEGYTVNSGDEQELVIQNVSFTQNGADVETLDDAYTNFKHTIGTFDTLVTCRDYANAIYQMVSSDSDNSNLVSNVQAADVRDDINFVNKIVTFNEYGIIYEDVKVPVSSEESGGSDKTISNFDVYIYPLNPIKSLYIARNYDNTFLPNHSNTYDIKTGLEEYKTLSHNICQVDNTFQKDFIYLIKNYYHLKAQIATTYKVSKYESEQIQNNISIALYQNFNARKLEYGEEIPYDSLLSVIQNADPRIKFVSLEEPKITTKIMTSDGNAFKFNPKISGDDGVISRKLIAKNVLAGRVPLFNYDRRFNYSYGESNYSGVDKSIYGTEAGNRTYYTTAGQETENCSLTAITTNLQIPVERLTAADGYTLRANESIQLKAPNISTQLTYPISVNYRFEPKTADEYPSIDADYRMQAGDILYIDYTDTNDIEHKIKYWVENDKPLYTDSAAASPGIAWSGIIRVNFDLGGKSESEARKSVIFDNLEPIKLWTLTNTDQIEIRKPVSVDLKSTLLCYWSTNNANRLIFTQEDNNSGSEFRYSYTLDSDEYFFYTDNLKNSLVTLGSGTTLTLISTSALDSSDLEWKLPNSAQVDIDDIASEGIGAFADTNWSVRKLSENKYLHIEENQLIILGAGTTIKLNSNTNTLSEIDSSWEKLEHSDSFTYDGNKSLAKFENLGDDIYWSIRAILNLNFGPDQSMELLEETDDLDHPVVQEIKLLTSGWKDGSTLVTDITSETDLFQYTEEIEEAYPIVEWSSVNQPGMRIKANFEIQKNGGKDVNVHRYSYSGSLQDDLQIYCFKYAVPTTGESGEVEIPLNTYLDNFTTIDFKASEDESGDSHQAALPVYIPEESFGLLMVYYSGNPDNVKMTLSSESAAGAPLGCIDFYNQSYNHIAGKPELTLEPNKINVIRVEEGCTLILSWDGFVSGSVTFSNVDIVKKTANDLSGVNTELLGLANESGDSFVEELKAIPGIELFYYNVPIENSTHLDVKTIDEYSWFNYNNICNKFVLAQIDTDLSEIEIAKSSRLGKW